MTTNVSTTRTIQTSTVLQCRPVLNIDNSRTTIVLAYRHTRYSTSIVGFTDIIVIRFWSFVGSDRDNRHHIDLDDFIAFLVGGVMFVQTLDINIFNDPNTIY